MGWQAASPMGRPHGQGARAVSKAGPGPIRRTFFGKSFASASLCRPQAVGERRMSIAPRVEWLPDMDSNHD